MKTLSNQIGETNFDNLFGDITPEPQVHGGVIRKLSTAATLKRGSIMAKSDQDNKLVVLGSEAAEGEILTPDCILCNDIDVGSENDEDAAFYTAGCFNFNKIIVSEGYTITASDLDKLRIRNLVFKSASTN